jgi:hypothetical protein
MRNIPLLFINDKKERRIIMKTFIEKLKTEMVFLWELPYETIRVLSVPDEIINGVWRIYIEKKIIKGEYKSDLKYSGILLNDTIWDAEYILSLYKTRFGITVDNLDLIKKQIDAEVGIIANRSIYIKTLSLAQEAIAFAKMDIDRMEDEPRTETEQKYNDFYYTEHNPKANIFIIDNLISDRTGDNYYSKGLAYKAFYKSGFDNTELCLVKSDVSTNEVLQYLAEDEQSRPAIIEIFANNLINETAQKLSEPDNNIINNLAKHLIAEEFYKELIADENGEHNLIKEIYDKTHKDDMATKKSINITVIIEGEVITFNIDKESISHENEIAEHQIRPVLVREQIQNLLKKRCARLGYKYKKIFLTDILEITYMKKTIYKKDILSNHNSGG